MNLFTACNCHFSSCCIHHHSTIYSHCFINMWFDKVGAKQLVSVWLVWWHGRVHHVRDWVANTVCRGNTIFHSTYFDELELFYCVYGIFGCSVEETSPSTAEHFDNNPRSFFLFCMPSWWKVNQSRTAVSFKASSVLNIYALTNKNPKKHCPIVLYPYPLPPGWSQS